MTRIFLLSLAMFAGLAACQTNTKTNTPRFSQCLSILEDWENADLAEASEEESHHARLAGLISNSFLYNSKFRACLVKTRTISKSCKKSVSKKYFEQVTPEDRKCEWEVMQAFDWAVKDTSDLSFRLDQILMSSVRKVTNSCRIYNSQCDAWVSKFSTHIIEVLDLGRGIGPALGMSPETTILRSEGHVWHTYLAPLASHTYYNKDKNPDRFACEIIQELLLTHETDIRVLYGANMHGRIKDVERCFGAE